MRFSLPYHWYRLMGISGLFMVGYIVVIGIFGNVNIGPLLPTKLAVSIQEAWPQLPFFTVETASMNGDQNREFYYTVPTRQFTPQEIARMGATNGVAHPAAPR